MKKILLSTALFLASFTLVAQVGIGTTNPNSSAALEISSTSKGLLLPRLTSTQAQLVTPVEGLAIYCTDCTPIGLYVAIGATNAVFTSVDGTGATISSPTPMSIPTTTFNVATVAPELELYEGASVDIAYDNGKGEAYPAIVDQVSSNGLVANMAPGTFANGSGVVTVNISGTPGYYTNIANTATNVDAVFNLDIGGTTVTINVPVSGTPFVFGANGKRWMDRNLGATQVATSSTDTNSYGDLYQWGRNNDGHQLSTSTSITLPQRDAGLVIDKTAAGNSFVQSSSAYRYDWLSTRNDNNWLRGTKGLEDPCPSGYRVPELSEFSAQTTAFSSQDAAGAIASDLKLPLAGLRHNGNSQFRDKDTVGYYWTTTIDNTGSNSVRATSVAISTTISVVPGSFRGRGVSVRCIEE